MKTSALLTASAFLLAGCAGSGISVDTLLGTYQGPWTSVTDDGATTLTFQADGHVSGQWTDTTTSVTYTITESESTVDGLHVLLHMTSSSTIGTDEFEGTLTKNGTHVGGALTKKVGNAGVLYNVSLDPIPPP
ncbi:MAG: hypothetical protein GC165_05170 [Armatimonadetes bacterium]|nr:hypothetical protein [Armatimonadota bacterium]